MAIDLLTVCVWAGSSQRDTVVSAPTWDDVETAIRALDGKARNDLYLYPSGRDADTYLCVGGGGGRYIVSGATGKDRFPTYTDPRRTAGPEEILVVGGQPGAYPAEWILGLDAALQAAHAFFEAGRFPASEGWVDA